MKIKADNDLSKGDQVLDHILGHVKRGDEHDTVSQQQQHDRKE